MSSWRHILDPEYVKWCQQEFDTIRQRRNNFKGKPDTYEQIEIELDRMFMRFYKQVVMK